MSDQPASGYLTDDQLIDRLGSIAAVVEPVPTGLLETARNLFGLGRVDAELAALVRDSADAPDRTLALSVRSDEDERLLSFEAGDAAVEMQVSERADRRDLVCHVIGVSLGAASLETPAGQQSLQVDDGVLIARDLHTGPIRLRLTTTAGASIVTSWVQV